MKLGMHHICGSPEVPAAAVHEDETISCLISPGRSRLQFGLPELAEAVGLNVKGMMQPDIVALQVQVEECTKRCSQLLSAWELRQNAESMRVPPSIVRAASPEPGLRPVSPKFRSQPVAVMMKNVSKDGLPAIKTDFVAASSVSSKGKHSSTKDPDEEQNSGSLQGTYARNESGQFSGGTGRAAQQVVFSGVNSVNSNKEEDDPAAPKQSNSVYQKFSNMNLSKIQHVVMNEDWEKTPLQRAFHPIVSHRAFNLIFGVLIIANAISIGAEVEFHARGDSSYDDLFLVATFGFCFLFLLEFLLRAAAIGRRFFHEREWGIFDAFMVIVSIIELFQMQDAARYLIRFARLLRLLRIVRVVKFSVQLQMMVFMILESMKSLVAAVVLLAMILYMFSVCFTLAATEYLDEEENPYEGVADNFGTVYRSAYACFKSITNGMAWGELIRPLDAVHPVYVGVFIFYISFSLFTLMNVITGVFVDTALARSQTERDILVEKELAMKRACVTNLKELFREADVDDSGMIDFQEFAKVLENDRVRSYLHALKIDTSNLVALFKHIDADSSGTITVDEFVERCLLFLQAQNTEQYLWRIKEEIGKMRDALIEEISPSRIPRISKETYSVALPAARPSGQNKSEGDSAT